MQTVKTCIDALHLLPVKGISPTVLHIQALDPYQLPSAVPHPVKTKIVHDSEQIEPDTLRLNRPGILLQKPQYGIIYKVLSLIPVAQPIISKPDKVIKIALDYPADDVASSLLKHTVLSLMLLPNKTHHPLPPTTPNR